MSENNKLVHAVHAALEIDSRINVHACAIKIQHNAGEVTLSGSVGDITAKRCALLRAAQVPGVRAVRDELRVAAPGQMGDGELRDHICHTLLGEPAFSFYKLSVVNQQGATEILREPPSATAAITIKVLDGVVSLDGHVGSLSHRRLAGALAWWVPGTQELINRLAVEPPCQDNDEEIAEAVRLVLEKDRLVSTDQITVSAKDFAVRLQGVVPLAEQRALAEHDAWYVEGVRDVRNELVAP